jgi:hypothetical protein
MILKAVRRDIDQDVQEPTEQVHVPIPRHKGHSRKNDREVSEPSRKFRFPAK